MIRTTIVTTDDLDGSTEGVGTYTFAIGGRQLEIDLTRAHHAELVAALAPFVAVARPARQRGRGRNALEHTPPPRVTTLPAQVAPDPVAFDARPRARRARATASPDGRQ